MSFISRVSGVVTEAKMKVSYILQSATLRAVCKALDYIPGQSNTHAFIL